MSLTLFSLKQALIIRIQYKDDEHYRKCLSKSYNDNAFYLAEKDSLRILLTVEMLELMKNEDETSLQTIFYNCTQGSKLFHDVQRQSRMRKAFEYFRGMSYGQFLEAQRRWIGQYSTQSLVLSVWLQDSLVQLCDSLSGKLDVKQCLPRDEWKIHRVMCWLVMWLLKGQDKKNVDCWFVNLIKEETCVSLVNYMTKVLDTCDVKDIEEEVEWILALVERLRFMIKTIVEELSRSFAKFLEYYANSQEYRLCVRLSIESWILKKEWRDLNKKILVKALQPHAEYHKVNIFTDFVQLDTLRYQAGFIAQWCIDKVTMEPIITQIPLVKLSRDRCEVKSDMDEGTSIPIRATFPVTSGVHYFEVFSLTDGVGLRVGWSNEQAQFSDENKLGDDQHSIGIELSTEQCHYIYHNANRYSVSNNTHPNNNKSISVIGCLIDLDNGLFTFYINGEKLDMQEKVHFGISPYYASAWLLAGQHCHFNFGQTPFAYPPTNVQFNDKNFHHQTSEKNKLARTELVEGIYLFKEPA